MLTGDKIQTAINIGLSCRLISQATVESDNLFVLDSEKLSNDPSAIFELLKEAKVTLASSEEGEDACEVSLVLSGRALDVIFPSGRTSMDTENIVKQLFLEVALQCSSVICCRVSPMQKAEIVRLVKENVPSSTTLAIGDGANDVPMIKTAHVGVGISGCEGLQAVMSSDYSIAQFRFLQDLILVHGQWSYRRICVLITYSFYKNILNSMVNIWFSFFSGFSGQLFFDPTSSSAYNLFFTAIPVMFAAVFNQDLRRGSLLSYPSVYKSSQSGSKFSLTILWFENLKAIFCSLVIFFTFFFTYETSGPVVQNGTIESLSSVAACCFTSVVIWVTVKIGIQTTTWVNWTYWGIFLSIAAWFLFSGVESLIPSGEFFDTYGIFSRVFSTPTTWLYIFMTNIACLIPELVEKCIYQVFYPDVEHVLSEKEFVDGYSEHQPSKQVVIDAQPLLEEEKSLHSPEARKSRRLYKSESLRYDWSGYTPSHSDIKDKDFVMSQKDFLRISLGGRRGENNFHVHKSNSF
eukprot:TRINITY_DN6839_c0_g2_i2.p1 TRINITY_DN6839_c0_g2~~TRINITY_DN6839_c0_g2_i2.p1  ORF type:complete len:519 (-),score=110.14 TRINITY_DN6839_c0_g2_i2:55-1611(-)